MLTLLAYFSFCLSFGSKETSSLWWSVGEGPLSDCYIVTLASSPLLYQEVSLTTTTIPEPAKCLTSQTLYLANRWSTFNINSDSTRVVYSSKSSHRVQFTAMFWEKCSSSDHADIWAWALILRPCQLNVLNCLLSLEQSVWRFWCSSVRGLKSIKTFTRSDQKIIMPDKFQL